MRAERRGKQVFNLIQIDRRRVSYEPVRGHRTSLDGRGGNPTSSPFTRAWLPNAMTSMRSAASLRNRTARTARSTCWRRTRWARSAIVGRNFEQAEWERYLPGVEYERTCPGVS